MNNSELDDARASDPVDRLLEESWDSRGQRASRRELVLETAAGALLVAIATPLAVPAIRSHPFDPVLALALVALLAGVAGWIRFPIGAGYVVPSYLVVVPMLLLLPPRTVPLLTATGMAVGGTTKWLARRASAEHVLLSVPNAWYSLGPAVVLWVAGAPIGEGQTIALFAAAFLAACIVDLGTSMVREATALGVAPRLQLRVIALVWLIDACTAPIGLLIAIVAHHNHAALLTVLPIGAFLLILERERSARITQAQHRLELVRRERTRLQAAVRRLGEAFAAKLELPALTSIVLHGSVQALDADAGRLTLTLPNGAPIVDSAGGDHLLALLEAAGELARHTAQPSQLQRDAVWALALPFGNAAEPDAPAGTLAVARKARQFRSDEQALILELVQRAQAAASEIVALDALRQQTVTDPLTGLGNRRRLTRDLAAQADGAEQDTSVLMLFDLDGFKRYNDTFGHLAGDALLARLAGKLSTAVATHGTAYRLGGDEFCTLLRAPNDSAELHDLVARAAGALCEVGETFSVTASCGAVLLPHEADTPDYALQLADERMYARKRGRGSSSTEHTRDVLIRIMHAKQPDLPDHSTGVARLAVAVGRRLGMDAEQLDELGRAAELHDIGKVGIPDAILNKPGQLDTTEWDFVRQHTMLAERILSASPALRPVGRIVRASHERWDGNGYPDRLSGTDIPLAARIVAVCDTYQAITNNRCYSKARSPQQARQELRREAGRQFDPAVVTAFLAELDQPQADHYQPAAKSASTDHHETPAQLADQITTRLLHTFDGRLDAAAPNPAHSPPLNAISTALTAHVAHQIPVFNVGAHASDGSRRGR